MNNPAKLVIAVLAVSLGSCGSDPTPEPRATPTPQTYAQTILGALDRAAIERTRGDMTAISTAIGGYSAGSGEFPSATDFTSLVATIAPTYIHIVPVRDAWGNEFIFNPIPAGGYELIAAGADGKPGTGDDMILRDGQFAKLPDGYRDL